MDILLFIITIILYIFIKIECTKKNFFFFKKSIPDYKSFFLLINYIYKLLKSNNT